MKKYSDSTLMRMTKAELIEQLRCAEHNREVAEDAPAQQAENLKDWEPVIRCRDCTFWTKGKYKQGPDPEHMEYVGSCALSRFDKTESNFCCCGERRKETGVNDD